MIESIKTSGFNTKQSPVPLNKLGVPVNGAHRIACCAYYDKKIPVMLHENCQSIDYSYRNFDTLPSREFIKIANFFYCHFASKPVHVAFLWPEGRDKSQLFFDSLSKEDIIYCEDVFLTLNGAHNLMSVLYENEPWLGSAQDNFPGVRNKLISCFKNDSWVKLVFFHSESLENVVRLKNMFRENFNVGKHSIHITDSKKEVSNVLDIFASGTRVDFTNSFCINKFSSTVSKLKLLADYLDRHSIDRSTLVINSGFALQLYGIRECDDIDVFHETDLPDDELVSSHNKYINYLNVSLKDVIYSQNHFVVFDGFKIISLELLVDFKRARNETKDRIDLGLIKRSKKNSGSLFLKKVLRFRYKLLILRLRIYHFISLSSKNLLARLGLLDTVIEYLNRYKR